MQNNLYTLIFEIMRSYHVFVDNCGFFFPHLRKTIIHLIIIFCQFILSMNYNNLRFEIPRLNKTEILLTDNIRLSNELNAF